MSASNPTKSSKVVPECQTVYLLIQYVDSTSVRESEDVYHIVRGVYYTMSDAVSAREKSIQNYQTYMGMEKIDVTVEFIENRDIIWVVDERTDSNEMKFEIQTLNMGEFISHKPNN